MKLYYESELYHHGIKGMKWGRRRYQNSDGSLTPAGKSRYVTVRQANKNAKQAEKDAVKALNNSPEKHTIREYGKAARAAKKQSIAKDKAYNKQLREERKAERNTPEAQAERRKKALKVGAAVAGTALAAYGAYKVNQYVKDNNAKIQAAKEYTRSTRDFEQTSRHNVKFFKEAQNSYNPMQSIGNEMPVGRNATVAGQHARETTNFRNAAKNVRNYKKGGGSLRDLPSVNSYGDERLVFEMDKTKKQFTRVGGKTKKQFTRKK